MTLFKSYQTPSLIEKQGFMVGYDCPYGKNNSLAIAGGIPTSPKDWYKDDANWPTSKALNVSDTLLVGGTRTKLSAFTDALSGNKDQIYNIWATVGSIESLRDA